MKLETFFEKFDQFADAPDAVARMRELVLNFAVQGKLVPQDSNDEPALADANGDLFANEPNTSAPFKRPAGWTWVKLDQLAIINGGFAFKSTDYKEDGTRVIRISDFDENGFKNHKIVRHPFTPELKKFSLEVGDILMAMTGGTVGKSFYVRSITEPMIVNQRVATIRVLPKAESSYIDLLIRSELTQKVIRDAKNSTNDNISMSNIKGFSVPLPPLAEQKRIVAKVDELMALCDRLEAQQQERDTRRAALARASLARFADAPTPANLNFLFHKSYDISPADLRKSILTLAVQGKLVPQDPDDEPALEWSDSLAHETLPNWILGKVVDLVTLKSGNTLPKSMELESGGEYLYLKVGDMNQPGNEQTITCSSRTVNPDTRTLKSLIPANSIIFPKRGGAIATNKKRLVLEPLFVDSNTMAMICPEYLELRYLQIWFLTIDLWKLNSGTSVPQINNKDINHLELPVPPVAEQCRIVAKVDQMLALVDELETHLAASRTTAKNLLEALVAELTAAGAPSRRGDA